MYCCSMSSFNCCFLQVSQEAGQVVWYSHLFQNFPQFIVIHTVKGFGIVKIDDFLLFYFNEYRLLGPWNSPGKNPGVRCHAVLQRIFPTQGSNPGLLHCRQILYHLSQQGSPRPEAEFMKGPSTKPGDSCHSPPFRSGLAAALRFGEPPGPLSGTRHCLVGPSHSGFCFLFCGTVGMAA